MSSLAATQADGYYAPPEYYESGQYKKKSVSQYAGSKGHNQYLQKGVVRFELPYDGFCKQCGEHVGKGTRFNARKTKAGAYFTSPVYQFAMTCRVCGKSEFVIQTNPKEQSFDYLEGIHKQVQEFDTSEAGTAGVIDTEYGNKLIPANGGHTTSALSHLESVASGARKSMTERDELKSIMTINHKTMLNDSDSNAAIRSTFRSDRTQKKRRLHDATAKGWKQGMELLDETDDDVISARTTCFGNGKDSERTRFCNLRKSSIFDTSVNRRKSRKRRSRVDNRPPDSVSSSSSSNSTKHAVSLAAGAAVKREDSAERRPIRLMTSGSRFEIEGERVAIADSAEKTNETTPARASLSALLADYGSDSD